MNDTKVKIIEAALDLFSRYGLKRVSVGEVAEAAGVSRQTLYAHYKNKEDLAVAAMQVALDRTFEDVEDRLGATADPSEQLDIFFETLVLKPYRLMQAQPDLTDLFKGVSPAMQTVAQGADARKAALLCATLRPHAQAIAQRGQTPEQLADFVVQAIVAFKFSAPDEAALTATLSTVRATVLAMIEPVSLQQS